VVVEGVDNDRLIEAWSALCQAGAAPPRPEFLAIYPYVTTVQGNRFRFRGGDPERMRENLARLFQHTVGGTVRAYLDPGVNGTGSHPETTVVRAERAPVGSPN
jgi:hypothetical protein